VQLLQYYTFDYCLAVFSVDYSRLGWVHYGNVGTGFFTGWILFSLSHSIASKYLRVHHHPTTASKTTAQ